MSVTLSAARGKALDRVVALMRKNWKRGDPADAGRWHLFNVLEVDAVLTSPFQAADCVIDLWRFRWLRPLRFCLAAQPFQAWGRNTTPASSKARRIAWVVIALGCRRSSSKSSIALSLTEGALDSLLTDQRSRVRAQRHCEALIMLGGPPGSWRWVPPALI
jgi:hypothetical protein